MAIARHRHVLLGVLVTVLAPILASGDDSSAASTGRERWDPAQRVGRIPPLSEYRETGTKSIGVDARGNVLLATRIGQGVRRRIAVFERRPGRAFGRPQVLSPPGFVVLDSLFVGSDGRGVVLWADRRESPESRRVFASVRPPGGRFGPAMAVPAPADFAYNAVGASDVNGNITVLFNVLSKRREASCEFSAECPIAGDLYVTRRSIEGRGFSSPELVSELAEPQGDPAVDAQSRIVTPLAVVGGGFDHIEVLRQPILEGPPDRTDLGGYYDANVEQADLAVNRRGDTVVAFSDADAGAVRVAISRAGGPFAAPVSAVRGMARNSTAEDPHVAIDSNGRTVVSAVRDRSRREQGDYSLDAAVASPSRRFGRPFGVSARRPVGDSDVAVDSRGRVVFVWSRDGRGGRSAIESRRLSRRGALGRVVRVARARARVLESPLVAITRGLTPIAVWELLSKRYPRERDPSSLRASVLRSS